MAEQKYDKDYGTKAPIQAVDTDYMDTSGDEDTTVWDNLVQALRPDLTPHHKK